MANLSFACPQFAANTISDLTQADWEGAANLLEDWQIISCLSPDHTAANKDRIEGATTTREATRMLADPEESKSATVSDLPRETGGGLPALFESLDALTADIEQLTPGNYLSHYEPAGAMFVFPSTKEMGRVWFTFCALDHVDRGEDHFVWFPFVGPHDPGVIAIFAHDFGIRAGDFITYENRSQKDPSESTAGLLMASQEVKAGIKHSKTNGDSTTTKPETKSHPSGAESETSVRPFDGWKDVWRNARRSRPSRQLVSFITMMLPMWFGCFDPELAEDFEASRRRPF